MRVWCPILFYSVLLLGCMDDAPRDNPLDPLSPKYTGEGSLTGRVVIANQTTGIEGAIIFHFESGTFVMTDSLGYFEFTKLSRGIHHFACTKQNFTGDTFQVQLQSGEPVNIVRGLNGAPVVLSQTILTRKIDQYFPSPQYFVDVVADVIDPNGNGDVASVWFGFDTLRFLMTYDNETRLYSAKIFKYQLPTNTIQRLVGKSLFIISEDITGALNISDPFLVSRVIEETATLDSPTSFKNDSVKADSLVFKWFPPDVTFNFTYTVSLWRVDGGIKTFVWSRSGLSVSNESWEYFADPTAVPLDVSAANYLWAVSIVDEFGNYAQSKESSFVVVP